MNIFDYIKKYGNKSFYEYEFNELDSMIFSSFSYLDLNGIVLKKISLNEIAINYLNLHKEEDELKKGNSQKFAYLVLKECMNVNRYKDVLCYNYQYVADDNTQFGAITFKINRKLKVISYEGTDHRLSGWKEDFLMGGMFPVNAQRLAINYINNTIKLIDSKYILVGHSKGGNLALVSGMFARRKRMIKKIYSLDGPGLRSEEYVSKEYEKIKNKYIHIIPNYSMVGVLMENDSFIVIDSPKKDMSAHSLINWSINDFNLVSSSQSLFSKKIEEKTKELLSIFDRDEYIDFVNSFFDEATKRNITHIEEIFNFKTSLGLLKGITSISEEKKKSLLKSIEEMIINNKK